MREKKKEIIYGKIVDKIILPVSLPIILIIFWEYAVKSGMVRANLIPAPSTLLDVFYKFAQSGKLWENLSISLIRVFYGFLIGAGLGLIFGILMGLFRPFNQFTSLLFSLLRPIPIIALVPIFICIFGIDETEKYAVIAIGSFWLVMMNTLQGVKNVDDKLLEVAYTYRISKLRSIFGIVLTSAVPDILTGIRMGVTSAWVSVVAAEMIAASKGLGFIIMNAKENSQTQTVYVGVLIIGFIGLVIDRVLVWIQDFYLKKSRGYTKK